MQTMIQQRFEFSQAPLKLRSASEFYPASLGVEAVVSLLEPSLLVCDDDIRTYLRSQMSHQDIRDEIDAISEVARLREEFGDFNLLGLKLIHSGYGCIDSGSSALSWMHEHERERTKQLKLALPTSGEAALEASQRIKARIEARKLRASCEAAA
jgi:hypothetical protein